MKDLVERLPADFHGLGILRLLGEALRIDINFIDKQPQFLFQCLWNRCWWFDSPQAAVHFEPPEDGWVPKGAPWERVDGRLYTMLERWRIEKENAAPGFHSRPDPPATGPTRNCTAVRAPWSRGYVGGLLTNGRMIALIADHNVRLWDADRGQRAGPCRYSGP